MSKELKSNVAALKDCDIRGTYPQEVYEELFEAVSYGFGQMIGNKKEGNYNEGVVILAGDARVSTPSLKESVIKGFRANPLKIIDLGMVPTNIAYWAKEKFNAQAIAIVTASHNPANYNGLKLMNGLYPPTPCDIKKLGKCMGCDVTENSCSQVLSYSNIADEYKNEIIEKFSGKLKSLKVVIDPGNGCLSGIASNIYKRLGARVISINDVVDGNFPGRMPDCAVPENLKMLKEAVLNNKADIGIAFDGDGDRLAIVDNLGRTVKTEHTAMILIAERLKNNPRQTVVMDVKCSSKLESLVKRLNGVPVRCKSGHAFMKRKVIDLDANIGVELSGHIFLKELSGRDDPLYTSLELTSILSELSMSLAEKVNLLPDFYMTEDIRIKLPEQRIEEIITNSAVCFDGVKVENTDGTRIVFDNGWVLARRSITEPKITIRIEGNTFEDLKCIAKKYVEVFNDIRENVLSVV